MKNLRRIGALLLAIAMMLSMMSINVFAEETYQETDPYVYLYGEYPDTEWQDKSTWYWSSHLVNLNGIDGTVTTDRPMVFPLYNMVTGDMIKAYCLDQDTPIADVSLYRRLNLEDSGYYDVSDAELLRAITLNGYWDADDLSDLQTAANTWLTSKGMDQIVDLTGAQAVSGTQGAIWAIANSSDTISVEYGRNSAAKASWLFSMYDTVSVNPQETEVLDDEGNNITQKNINLLIEYLINLDGVAASTVLVSDAMLADATVSDAVLEDDGTYSVTVTANIDGVKDGDELYLTAASGDKSATVAVTSSGAQTVTLTGLTEEEANGMITAEINGTQTGSDVYMYDAPGNRGTSQTLIGYDETSMPVQARAVIDEEERVLKIHKTTPADEQGNTTPLPNIHFVIYQVATTEQIESGEVVLGAAPSDEDLAKYATKDYEVVTITTDANGYAEYNFSRNGMPDGVYIVVERPTESIKEAVDPFFVTIPYESDNAGGGLKYSVEINLENEVIADEPQIDESVTWLGNTSDTVDVRDTITWIIDSYIPFDIGTGMSYEVTTEVDSRLTAPSDVKVAVSKSGVDEVIQTLIPDTDCTVVIVEGENGGGKLTVVLTDTGMKKVSELTDEKPEEYVIRITLQNVINSNASVGENIPNSATVEYTNSVGIAYEKKSREVEVHTGGLKISKVDDAGNAVAGAVFKIAREASEEEIANDEIEKVTVGGRLCVYVDFYMTENFFGEKVYEVTTDKDGKALIYGIAYGEYNIIEVSVPSGYIMDRTPIEAEVNGQSHTAENIIKVVNSRTYSHPDTDDINTSMLAVAVLVLMSSIIFLYVAGRKRSKNAE